MEFSLQIFSKINIYLKSGMYTEVFSQISLTQGSTILLGEFSASDLLLPSTHIPPTQAINLQSIQVKLKV